MTHDDDLSELFADLTAILEDAAALCVEGQNPAITEHETSRLIQRMRLALERADRTLLRLPELRRESGP